MEREKEGEKKVGLIIGYQINILLKYAVLSFAFLVVKVKQKQGGI